MNEEIKKPNSYTSEFKESAVKLAIESDQTIAATARELGINVNTLHTWIEKYSTPKQVAERDDEHIYDEKTTKKEGKINSNNISLILTLILFKPKDILNYSN